MGLVDSPASVAALLRDGRALREVDHGVLSALAEPTRRHFYDGKGAMYDLVVGGRLYNRLVWGADRRDYAAFERLALESDESGWVLDAGCGSLVFTADVLAQYRQRPVVLLDQSLDMLRRAQRRLERRCGRVPGSVILVQADVFDLPFRSGSFQTVSCPGLLHLFADPQPLVAALVTALAAGGGLYMTSLVRDPARRLANWYLGVLERAGEIAPARTLAETVTLVEETAGPSMLHYGARGNMAYYANRAFW